jgi:LacI family repressor for deo operon, udp, cdd, tsx, nupC, and nupG
MQGRFVHPNERAQWKWECLEANIKMGGGNKEPMITIKDVAAAANVSIVTVSRVLNNSGQVAEKSRKKVEEAIKALNYSLNANARALVTKSTNVIGVIIPDIANIYTPSIITSLASELRENGYDFFLSITNGDSDREEASLNMMLEKRVDGIILLGSRPIEINSNKMLKEVSQRIPVVIVDYTSDNEMYCVRSDEVTGVFLAVEYLAKLGHKKIGFINGSGNYTTHFYKQAGFEKALMDFGITLPSKYCVHVEPYFSGGLKGANILLDMDDRPTAIFAAGDQIAIGVYFAVQSRGMKIPDDISVVGFSGTPISGNIYPPLTTVDQYPEETGKAAARMIVNILNKREIPERQIIIRPKLIVRGSCSAV